MSMIRPMIRSMRRPIIRGIIRTPSIVSRILMSFDATAFTHLVYAKPVVLAADWRMSANYATTSSADISVFGDSGGGSEMRFKFSTGEFLLIVDGDFNSFPGVLTGRNDGKFRKAEVFHFGLDLLLYLDDVFAGSQSTANTLTIDRGGQSGTGARYFDGELANLQLEDITNAIPLTFRVDEATASFELPVENVFGSELGGFISIGAGWTDNLDGSYDWSSGSSATTFEIATGLVSAGEVMLLEFTVTNYTGTGNFGLSSTTTSAFSNGRISSNGDLVVAFPLDGSITDKVRLFARDTHTLTISNISMREVTNAITYINAPDTIRENFRLSNDETQWVNISPEPQELPAVIEIFNAIRYSPLTASYTSAGFTPIVVTNTEIISFHVKGLTTSATIQYLMGGTVESSWIFYQGSTGNLRLVDDAANVTEATFTGLNNGGDYYVEIRLTATGWDLYVNNVFKVSAVGTVGDTTLDRLAHDGNATSMTLGTIYGVTLGASASWPMQSGFDDQFDDRDMIGTNDLTYTGAPGPITDADTIETENL